VGKSVLDSRSSTQALVAGSLKNGYKPVGTCTR